MSSDSEAFINHNYKGIYLHSSEDSETESGIGEINGRSVKILNEMKIVGGLATVIVAGLALCGLLQLHHYIPNDATWLTNIGEPGLWSMLVGAIIVEGGIIASPWEDFKALGNPPDPLENDGWCVIESARVIPIEENSFNPFLRSNEDE